VYMLERAIKEFEGFGANLLVNLDQFYFNLVTVSISMFIVNKVLPKAWYFLIALPSLCR